MVEIKTVVKDSLFKGVKDNFQAYCLHRNSVSVPNCFSVIAESDKCVEVIRNLDGNMYGVLFHPEVRNTEIVLNFLSG